MRDVIPSVARGWERFRSALGDGAPARQPDEREAGSPATTWRSHPTDTSRSATTSIRLPATVTDTNLEKLRAALGCN
jgi:hypothetical protein